MATLCHARAIAAGSVAGLAASVIEIVQKIKIVSDGLTGLVVPNKNAKLLASELAFMKSAAGRLKSKIYEGFTIPL